MISRSPREYELTKTIETLENTIKILKKLRAAEKKAWEKNAGKAHSDVRSLGKAEVAGSIPVASSKYRDESYVLALRAQAAKSCRCDGGNNNCSACSAERELRNHGLEE